jgi:hypothetical protein
MRVLLDQLWPSERKENSTMRPSAWLICMGIGVALVLVCATSQVGWSQDEPAATPPAETPAGPRQMMTKALDGILAGLYEQAYEALRREAVETLRAKKEAFAGLAEQTKKGIELYGRPSNYELSHWQSAGRNLVRLHYVVRCPKHPLRWEGTFYRAENKWQLIDVSFNDELDQMFID